MHLSTVSDWLAWLNTINSTEMVFGLERVRAVASKQHFLTAQCPVIIVGGTNGKGSTVSALESIYSAAGYRVGTFTSPMLLTPHEQIRLNGKDVSDELLCLAFSEIDKARGDIVLTPFEFFTLAALWVFHQQPLDVLILEIGLGGRLDAVNIMDADLAIITSIDIDHREWLGDTREAIGFEKAGILRPQQLAVYGDLDPPATVMDQAKTLGTKIYYQGKDFSYNENKDDWTWQHANQTYTQLPRNGLMTQNMANVMMAIQLLQEKLPVTRDAIDYGLRNVKLIGRMQIVPGDITTIYDVAHNPAAVNLLAKKLATLKCSGKTHAVFSMLADKDMATSVQVIEDQIDDWYVAPLNTKRAASEAALKKIFTGLAISSVQFFSSIKDSYAHALKNAQAGDHIVVFGSFHTVAEIINRK